MIKKVLYAHEVDMGGFPVRQPLPTQNIDQIDPFLLLHHATVSYQEGSSAKTVGVGPHPHRGFSPVTFIFEGDVHHRDSRNNSSVVKAGGVQWMNAGMGIVHSERPSHELAESGGTQEIVQLWINTPQSKKMDQPVYQAFQKEELPKISEDISLIAGNEGQINGPIHAELPVKAVMGVLGKGNLLSLSIDYQHAFIYVLSGGIKVKMYGLIEKHNLGWIENEASTLEIEGMEDSKFLLLSADPLNEPVSQYGPFVMNTQTEIMEAMRDYQMGKMGVLIEDEL